MPTPAKTARERAEGFLRDAVEFRLGPLVTEASHPRSTELSQVARESASAGLAVLFDVDRDVVETYDRWSRSGQPEALRDDVLAALEGGGRIFFTGCGATGRLSIQLASTWRAFWQDRRERGLATPAPGRVGGPGRERDGRRRLRPHQVGGGLRGLRALRPQADRRPRRVEGRHGLRDHGGRGDLLRDRHRVAGARGRRPRRLRLQQPRRGAADPREAQPRGHRRAPDPQGQPDHRPHGHHGFHADAGHEHRAPGHDHRAGDDAPRGPRARRGRGAGPRPVGRRARGDARRPARGPRRADGRAPAPRPRPPRGGRGAGLPPGRSDLLLRRLPRGGRADRHHRAQPHLLHALLPQVGRRGGLRVVGVPLHSRADERGGLDAPAPPRAADDRVDGSGPARAPRRGGGGETGRDPGRDRPARAAALPDRPRRPGLPAGARGRRRHGRGGGEGPSPPGGRGRLRPPARAGAGGRGLRGRDRRGPGGPRSRGSPRRPRPAETTG